jgi:hypothetical protein
MVQGPLVKVSEPAITIQGVESVRDALEQLSPLCQRTLLGLLECLPSCCVTRNRAACNIAPTRVLSSISV